MRWLALWLLAASVLDFSLMGADKRRAKAHRRRVPEKVFFWVAVLGGSPGAILGMWIFRHKTRHWYFRAGFPLLFLFQALLLFFLWRWLAP